jgi:hypothetical protein
MKVFITCEVEKKDLENGGMSDKTYKKMMSLIDDIRSEDIPVQFKETDIPRWKRASDV